MALKSVVERFDQFLWTQVLGDQPQFQDGEQVVVVNNSLQRMLGDERATVVECSYQFYQWEYRIIPNDPDGFLASRIADDGVWAVEEMIEPVTPPPNQR